jgi:hypothetical protein
MNRRERRRYAAELRALARSGVKQSELHCDDGWTCDCTGCRLIRCGMCLQCAAAVTALIVESKEGDTIRASLCSGACREGMERYLATRNECGHDSR